MSFDKFQRRRPRSVDTRPEWGDALDVRRMFGIRQTKLRDFSYAGLVKSVLLKSEGRTRGKRLYDLNSIRALLASESSK